MVQSRAAFDLLEASYSPRSKISLTLFETTAQLAISKTCNLVKGLQNNTRLKCDLNISFKCLFFPLFHILPKSGTNFRHFA